MKKIKNKIASAALLIAAGCGFSACDIDMLPLNEVVYENYWTNKDDVESVVASCYASMQSSDYQTRLLVWGECRSDNTQPGSGCPTDMRHLMKGSLKTSNTHCDWSSMYKAINMCNVVLFEAPQVAQKDPNYTTSDLNVNIAEAKFIRAYSYLTLIKTFRDVPFTFEASIDDTQNYRLPQTSFETILDSLITDVEDAKNYAPIVYTEFAKNTGRVTRAAMYSLLSELYLWRASDFNLSRDKQNEYYRKCIEAADWVLQFKIDQYDNDDYAGTQVKNKIDQEVYQEYGYPLLAEELTVGRNENGPEAFNAIFCNGQSSYESIFELNFNYVGSSGANGALNNLFGDDADAPQIIAAEKVFESKPDNSSSYSDNRLFPVPSDYRIINSFYYNETSGGYDIYKYAVDKNQAGTSADNYRYGRVGTTFTASTNKQNINGGKVDNGNFIIYRLTELMLFRAEAEIELAFNMDASASEAEEAEEDATDDSNSDENSEANDESEEVSNKHKATILVEGNSLATADELKEDAFKLISAVYRRSNPVVKTNAKYAPTMPTTYDAFHSLLMNERRREFLFEGKRYFDLVRSARRAGNTQELRKAVSSKYSDAGPAVTIKLAQMSYMYMPVLKSEMKVNPNLVQNESYLDEQENTKN